MHRPLSPVLCRVASALVIPISIGLQAEETRVLRVVDTFEEAAAAGSGRDLRPISYWKWSEEEKRNAGDYSQLERAALPGAVGEQGLKVSIRRALPKGLEFFALWSTGLDYLPPETTAIRMRARVVSGRFTLSVGGPTAYFATSDVRARPQTLEPDDDWQTITFSLVSDLERNYRRPIFSEESPVIYYTRWIQEPMRLLVGADSVGELWLDDIELIGSGEGKTFPEFAEDAILPLATANLGGAFTFATDDREFDLSHTPGKEPVRHPAILQPLPEGPGRLEARQRGLEEMSFIGVPATCPEGANAFRLKLKLDHEGDFEELAVDVLALVAPGAEFPWEKTRAATPQEGGYDFCLSPRRTAGMPWGFYHARRAVGNRAQATLVIPFEDFVCGYGTGDLRDRHQLQQPIQPAEVMAVALVSPYRQGRADTVFTIESIEAVKLRESAEGTGISYPQVNDVSTIRLEVAPGDLGKKARQVKVR